MVVCLVVLAVIVPDHGRGHRVQYSVTGSASALNISYLDGSGSAITSAEQHLPWAATVKTTGSTAGLTLTIAPANGLGAPQAGCTISVDGAVVARLPVRPLTHSITCSTPAR